jgi:hypothetical protein
LTFSIPDPGSRDQKSNESWIRNTGVKDPIQIKIRSITYISEAELDVDVSNFACPSFAVSVNVSPESDPATLEPIISEVKAKNCGISKFLVSED